MAFQGIHYPYAVSLGTTVIGGLADQDLETGSEIRATATDGEPYPRFISLVAQRPTGRFSTHSIAAALGVAGTLGASIATLTGVTFWAQKYASGGTRAGATSHRKYNCTKGIVVPTRLSVDADGDATISYDVVIVHDGTNDPIVITENQSLATLANYAERFTLGPVKVGNIALPQPTSLEIDFGLRVATDRDASTAKVWPEDAWIESVAPRITIRGKDVTWFKSTGIPLAGLACMNANTILYLRKRAAGGIFVADATTEHIQFNAAGMAHVESGGSFRGAGEVSVVVTPYFDGTNSPITVDTTAAIV